MIGNYRKASFFVYLLTLILGLLCSAPVCALDPQVTFRNYRLDRWGVEDGLPQLSVLSITQDRYGYLWAGTQNGIARFDGNQFETFDRAGTGVDTTLAGCGFTDSKGIVWFCTPRGVVKIVNGRLLSLAYKGQTLEIFDIAENSDGTLLFASSKGVLREKNQALENYLLGDKHIVSFHRNKADVWIASENEIWQLRANKLRSVAVLDDVKIRQVVKRNADLWLASSAGVIKFNPDTKKSVQVIDGLREVLIERMHLDHSGNMWISTTQSLHRVRPNNEIENIKDSEFIPQAWVRSFFEDRDGDLWLGSQRESLLRLRDSAVRWISSPEGLTDSFVWSIERGSNGELLIGTNAGLFAMDKNLAPKNLLRQSSNGARSIYDLTRDGDKLWVGTRAGIALYQDGRLITPAAMQSLNTIQINGIYPVGDQDMWIATMQGLYRFRNNVLTAVGTGAGEPAGRIRHLLIADAEHFLFSTEDGIFQYSEGVISRPVWSENTRGNFVPRMKWIKPDLLAFTTMDSGLGLVRGNKLLMLGTEDGLPSRNGWTLDVIDGQLYVASIVGAYRVALSNLPDPVSGAKQNVRAQMVVESSAKISGAQRLGCCNGGARARSLVDGKLLWLTSTSGIVRLDTARLPSLPEAPDARVERLSAGDVHYTLGQGDITLPAEQRDLSIQYTGMTLRQSPDLEFRYRLNGYEKQWREAGTRRTAFYTHVPPGDYSFSVQARYPGGDYGPESEELGFSLQTRWYERSLLQVLLLLLGIGLIAALLWRRISILRRQKEKLESAVAMRTLELKHSNELLERANQALHFENRTDPLTGLLNRRALVVPQHCAMILIDVDLFKRINDKYGHEVGDRALSAIADILHASIRSQDRALRWGGEEFLLIFDNMHLDDAVVRAEAIRKRINEHRLTLLDGSQLSCTCSFGVSAHPVLEHQRENWQASLQLADAGLYRAKARGRNLVCAARLGAEIPRQPLDFGSQDVLAKLEQSGQLIWVGFVQQGF